MAVCEYANVARYETYRPKEGADRNVVAKRSAPMPPSSAAASSVGRLGVGATRKGKGEAATTQIGNGPAG
jgi:hypothetical protein